MLRYSSAAPADVLGAGEQIYIRRPVMYVSLAHRVDVYHRRQQEEEQLRELGEIFVHRGFRLVRQVGAGMRKCDQAPDQASREDYRLRLSEVRKLL